LAQSVVVVKQQGRRRGAQEKVMNAPAAIDRRTAIAAGIAAACAPTLAGAADPRLGLIFPVEDTPVSPEAKIMYPTGITFLPQSLGLKELTPAGYDQVVGRIAPAASALAERGAQAITLMGTSLSFYKGAAFNRELTEAMSRASGLKCVTMSTAVVDGLRTVGAKRLAVATAYNEVVNHRLRSFLSEEGFEVLNVKGLGMVKVEDLETVTEEALLRFSAEVFESAPTADALLVSCGGLRTLGLLAPLEQRCKAPVVSSLPHALRAGVRLLGQTGQAPGFGSLLQTA
jgi:arylmalonate decarboxylase